MTARQPRTMTPKREMIQKNLKKEGPAAHVVERGDEGALLCTARRFGRVD